MRLYEVYGFFRKIFMGKFFFNLFLDDLNIINQGIFKSKAHRLVQPK